jgi:hypothetical protein
LIKRKPHEHARNLLPGKAALRQQGIRRSHRQKDESQGQAMQQLQVHGLRWIPCWQFGKKDCEAAMIKKLYPFGYLYAYMHKQAYGWRQIGPDALMIPDDFGNLVFVGTLQ